VDRERISPKTLSDSVQLNLSGSFEYNPTLSWACKLRASGDPASELFICVDDLSTIAGKVEDCWQACHHVAS
jgi:hypothetical protein